MPDTPTDEPARVAPPSMTLGALLDAVRAAPQPDDEFAADVGAARRALAPIGDPEER
jgi:hypothetical protein